MKKTKVTLFKPTGAVYRSFDDAYTDLSHPGILIFTLQDASGKKRDLKTNLPFIIEEVNT